MTPLFTGRKLLLRIGSELPKATQPISRGTEINPAGLRGSKALPVALGPGRPHQSPSGAVSPGRELLLEPRPDRHWVNRSLIKPAGASETSWGRGQGPGATDGS